MPQDHESHMRIALEEAAKAGAEGNAAVGSVIVKDGEVVARGRNLVNSTLDVTAHAETVALREAGKSLGQLDMSGCTLYTTFEPCPMCCGALMVTGINTLVMGARHYPTITRWGSYTVETMIDLTQWGSGLQVVTGVLSQQCLDVRGEWGKSREGSPATDPVPYGTWAPRGGESQRDMSGRPAIDSGS